MQDNNQVQNNQENEIVKDKVKSKEKNKSNRDTKKRNKIIITAIVSLIVAVAIIIIVFAFFMPQNSTAAMTGANFNTGQNNMFMEEEVVISDIVVGVTEMGSASLISTDISFDFQTTILEVVAKPGEYVEQGDTIAIINPEQFEEQYDEAVRSLESAQLSLSSEQISLQTTTLNASQTYDNSIIDGENAQNVYNLNIAELESGYNEIVAEITSLEAQKTALENQIATVNALTAQLATLNTELATLNSELATIDALIKMINDIISDPTIYDPAIHIGADNSNDGIVDAADLVTPTANKTAKEAEITAKKAEITNKEAEIQTAEGTQQSGGTSGTSSGQSLSDQLAQIVASISQKYTERDNYAASMELEKIDYYQEYEKTIQTYTNAGTQYNVTVQTADNKLTEAQLNVQELQAEVDALTSLATDGTVIATTSGYILSIQDEGASLNANATIASIANSTTAIVYVSIPQEDIADIEIDMSVNIVFDAYEDNIVTAVVDSISLTPSGGMSSSVNYTVGMEVYVGAFDGMVIFEGMTADVTFVEKQVLDVLVISNKCVELIDGKQYVKMYDENGEVIQVEVTTGFSDGFDVEIVSGLKQGDVVLLESAVSQNAP